MISPPGSSVHGISQARLLEWVVISFYRDLSKPGIKPLSPKSPALQAHSLPAKPPRKPHKMDRNKHNSNDLTIVYMDNFLKTIQNKYIKGKNRSDKCPII